MEKHLSRRLRQVALVLLLGNVWLYPSARGATLKCDADNGGITLPSGFCALVVADNLGNARHLVVRDNGDVYVALGREHRVVALRDTDGDGRADVVQPFGDRGDTGIGIHKSYLYVGTPTAIIRFPLKKGELLPGESAETVINDFPQQRRHDAKTFTFDNRGNIYVNVGAPSNVCQQAPGTPGSPGLEPCPQLQRQAGIWRFAADRLGQNQADGDHFASGVRNAVAIDWRRADEHLYVVQHGRDQLHQLWPWLYTVEQGAELPAEEFLRVEKDDDFGWPYCYYDQRQKRLVLAPEYGGDGREVGRCSKFKDPVLAFPGHWAPDGLLFYTGRQFPSRYRGGAFIAFHGSWNRAPLPQRGYNVVFVPFTSDEPQSRWEIFANGFTGAKTVARPSQARYRPVGLAQGPDGSLYVADSERGRVWRVVYTGL